MSSNIAQNLVQAKTVYESAPFHLMLVTSTVFTRAWCLYELAVRRLAEKETLPVLSSRAELWQGLASRGDFFAGMAATKEGDKATIRSKIVEAFGNRFDLDMKPAGDFVASGGRWIQNDFGHSFGKA